MQDYKSSNYEDQFEDEDEIHSKSVLHKVSTRPSKLQNLNGSEMTVPDFLNMVDKLKLEKQEGIAAGPAIKAFGFANTQWAVMKKDEEKEKRSGKRDYKNEIDKLRILLPSNQQGGQKIY